MVPHGADEWTRSATFGTRFTARTLSDFTDAAPPMQWQEVNPYGNWSSDELLATILAQSKWRYHHGIRELQSTGDLYRAYSLRVEALLEMVTSALCIAGVDIAASSFIDLGAAEGYVVNHLVSAGAVNVDAVEIAEVCIERMWQVRALKSIDVGRVGRVDLERANWSRGLGRTYDVVLALGVIYHMENPMLFARNVFATTEKCAIIESDTPLFPANDRFRGFGNVYLHRDQVTVAPGAVRYITEMRPDRQALAEMLLEAGFARVRVIAPPVSCGSPYFVSGEKSVVLAET